MEDGVPGERGGLFGAAHLDGINEPPAGITAASGESSRWSLPGGWADVGESPGEAAVRETREESGYGVRAVRLISAYDRDRHGHPPIPYHVYKLVFLCEVLEEAPSSEADGVGFFAEDELPDLSTTRVTPAQIRHSFEHHRDPTLAADFD